MSKQKSTIGTTARYHPARGSVFEDKLGPIKVMAVADRWAMVRRPGAIPFCIFVNELMTEYTLRSER